MKIRIVFATILFSAFSVFATGFSNQSNEVYLAITEWVPNLGTPGTNEPFRFDSKLTWAAYCDTGRVSVWYPLDPAYGIRVKLFGPDGQQVVKTHLGNSYGSKWGELHGYKDTRLQPYYAQGSFADNHGEGSGGFIPSPKELFKIEDPGVYTMEIEMQMFRYDATRNTDNWSQNLIRFSPIIIKVVKPKEK